MSCPVLSILGTKNNAYYFVVMIDLHELSLGIAVDLLPLESGVNAGMI